MGMSPRSGRRVALILENDNAQGRRVLEGIARYLEVHGTDWHLQLEVGTGEETGALRHWQGDGIIARVLWPRIEKRLRDFDVPKVLDRSVRPVPGHRSPTVIFAWGPGAGQAAFEHLAGRGFTRLAYCPMPSGQSWSRQQQFADVVTSAGKRYQLLPPPRFKGASAAAVEAALESWVAALPKPVGIYTANDLQGYRVLAACRAVGAVVPDEVAVLGYDNDEALCALCSPHLSSVHPHLQHVGYRAAETLEAMMAAETPPQATLATPPDEVVVRASTDTAFVGDPEVRSAMAYIRDHFSEPINVKDVAHHTAVSRRTLERRFKQSIGRTPAEELLRVRIERAKRLLGATELRMPQIAARCGFTDASRLTVGFQRAVGRAPTAFRREARLSFLELPQRFVPSDR
jgi:LacI family transcriptional regulator